MTERIYTRDEAEQFLRDRGMKIARTTLRRLAAFAAGPRYHMDGPRAIYQESDLIRWFDYVETVRNERRTPSVQTWADVPRVA